MIYSPTADDIERFWTKVQKTDDCWLWIGGRFTKRGEYGQFHLLVNGKKVKARAHRVSYEMEHGPIPEGMDVLHKCDRPPCVNPRCLFLGTPLDNTRDMIAKGRQDYSMSYGENNGRSKISDEEVQLIISGKDSAIELSKRLGIHRVHVHAIRRGQYRSCIRE